MRIVNAELPQSLAGINYALGRGQCPYPVDAIVIHCTEGDAASVRAWFRNPDAEVSAHYMVRKDGGIEQFVDEDDKAFHAGQPVRPTAALVLERAPWTPNSWAIGVEHESSGREELTDAQRAASYELIADIVRRRAIPVDRDHIIAHREVKASKTCPGAIDVDRIVYDVAELLRTDATNDQRPADRPRVVWSNVLNDYLAVVRYVSDAEWYYAQFSQLETIRGQRATTPLSQMPLGPPP